MAHQVSLLAFSSWICSSFQTTTKTVEIERMKDIQIMYRQPSNLYRKWETSARPKKLTSMPKLYSQALKEAKCLKISGFDTVDRLFVDKIMVKVGTSLL